MKVAPIALTEQQCIERALDELLKVATSAKPPWPRAYDGPIQASDLMRDYFNQTDAQRRAGALLDNPIGAAVRQSITVLGERLHEIGGLALMSDVLDRVAALDPTKEGRRMGIMDRRWDGIGRGDGKAGWCC